MWFSRRISEPSTASLKHTQQNCTFRLDHFAYFNDSSGWSTSVKHAPNGAPGWVKPRKKPRISGKLEPAKWQAFHRWIWCRWCYSSLFWDRRFEGVLVRDINDNCLWWIKVQGSLYEPGSKLLTWGWSSNPQEGILTIGYINPYYWVDEFIPLLSGNNGGWSTRSHIYFVILLMVHPGPKKIDFGGFLQDWGQHSMAPFCGGIKQLMLKSMGFVWGDFHSKK